MGKFKELTSLSIIESCKCIYCSKIKDSYVFKFKKSNIYFYAWDKDDGGIRVLYLIECPYKNERDMFFEISFLEAFDLLNEEDKLSVIFNLDLFK